MRSKNGMAAMAAVALTGLLMMTMPGANADTYGLGGTVVYKQSGQAPAADKGTMACVRDSGVAVGGACLSMSAGNFVHVQDAKNAENVAFQVCIDNNGDGVCTDGLKDATGQNDPCADVIFFSHDDAGNFHNPLGPLPGRASGCPDAPWNGYIVFLCQGIHIADGTPPTPAGTPHTHETTVGTIGVEPAGTFTGFGNFCGGAGRTVVEKPYEVIG